MPTTFVPFDDRPAQRHVATATARQVARFRDWLRAEAARLGVDLLPVFREDNLSFDARVCPLAIASVAARFDHDEHVIAVVEEAQFMGRRVTFAHHADGVIELALSSSPNEDLGRADASAAVSPPEPVGWLRENRRGIGRTASNAPYPDDEDWDATLPGEYDPDNGWDDDD